MFMSLHAYKSQFSVWLIQLSTYKNQVFSSSSLKFNYFLRISIEVRKSIGYTKFVSEFQRTKLSAWYLYMYSSFNVKFFSDTG